jgi:dolichol-phosphate mannosyltransferase
MAWKQLKLKAVVPGWNLMLDSISRQGHSTFPAPTTSPPATTFVLIPITAARLDDREMLTSCVASIKQSFVTLGQPHEIVLLLPANVSIDDSQLQELGVSQIVSGTLAQALGMCADSDAKQIAIVDPEIRCNEAQWKWLADIGSHADLACYFQKHPSRGNWRNRVAQAMVGMATRITLRTGKHDGRPGVTLLDASRLRLLLTNNLEFESAAELIALCREDGYSVAEARLTLPQAETTDAPSLRQQAGEISRAIRFWWNNLAFPSHNDASQSNFSPAWKLPTRVRWLGATVLIAIAATILFSNLNYAFLEPDETRNAQLGLNIYQSGDWLSLQLSQENYWDKPPLQAWLTAASYHLFGPSQFATRVPCAAATMLTILTVLLLGSKVFDERTGFLGAALLLLSSGFLLSGRYVTMDASLTCFSTIMILTMVLGFSARTHSRLWLLLAGIACGLGILTKGPVIGVLVLPPVLLAGWLEQNRMLLNARSWLLVGVPAFLISAPWFLATAIVHPDFLYYFFWKHNVARFSNAFNHQQPWWFYVPVLMLMMYPACFLIPLFIKTVISCDRSRKSQLGDHFGKLLLYVLWVIGFFSLSESKLPTYIIPAMPILCLLLGKTLVLTAGPVPVIPATGKWLSSLPRHMSISVSSMVAGTAAVLLFVFPSPLNTTWACVLLGLLAVMAFLFVRRIRSLPNVRAGLTAVALAGLLFVSLLVTQLLPKIAESRSIHAAISELAATPMYHDSPIVFMGRPPYGNTFWLPDRKIYHFSDEHEMDALVYLMNHPTAILVASKQHIKSLQRNLIGAEFQKAEGHRKLYAMHPRPDSDAASRDGEQNLPVRVSRLPFSGR